MSFDDGRRYTRPSQDEFERISPAGISIRAFDGSQVDFEIIDFGRDENQQDVTPNVRWVTARREQISFNLTEPG